jgi:Aspartyl protease
MSSSSHTDNDEAIARALQDALEREDGDSGGQDVERINAQEHIDAEMARRLTMDQPPNVFVQGNPVPSTPYQRSASAPRNRTALGGALSPSSFPGPPSPHMCVVPCVVGHGTSICVEMMIDTGAQTSVMSLSLAQQLKLPIDRRHRGVASGVGTAQIVGKIHNAPVELGHVEFPMDFLVLESSTTMMLLGLDLMRRYKCIVDLEREVLIFGGKGGVEVAMLPAEQQHIAMRNSLGTGCPMM